MPVQILRDNNPTQAHTGAKNDLTVAELSELWDKLALKYLLVDNVREFIAWVARDFKEETRSWVAEQAIAEAKEWEKDHRGKQNCEPLDDAFSYAWTWITTVAPTPPVEPKPVAEMNKFASKVAADIVALVEAEARLFEAVDFDHVKEFAQLRRTEKCKTLRSA